MVCLVWEEFTLKIHKRSNSCGESCTCTSEAVYIDASFHIKWTTSVAFWPSFYTTTRAGAPKTANIWDRVESFETAIFFLNSLLLNHLHFWFFLSFSDGSNASGDNSELFSLLPTSLDGGDAGYLNQATTELTAAMEKEKEGEFSCAIRRYRTAVDILITGVQGKRMYEENEADGMYSVQQ